MARYRRCVVLVVAVRTGTLQRSALGNDMADDAAGDVADATSVSDENTVRMMCVHSLSRAGR